MAKAKAITATPQTTVPNTVASKHYEIEDQKLAQKAFDKVKVLPKSEVMKIKPGTWIELKWMDSPNNVVLLLEKPDRCTGDVSLFTMNPSTLSADHHAIHSQVVSVVGPWQVPELPKS